LDRRVAWSVLLLSENEALQPRRPSAGDGAPGRIIQNPDAGTSPDKRQDESRLMPMEVETASLAKTNGAGWRRSGISRGIGFDVTPMASRGGFKAASRHTARVRLLRGTAIAGSILAIVLISAAVLLNPLRRLPVDVSLGRVGVDGTKITVDSPKITGLQKDGHPFEILARTGIQDITNPNTIELRGVDSKIGASDATTWVSAQQGIYDSANDKMNLKGDVRIKNSTGYDLRLNSARMDFKTGGLVSLDPVEVQLDGGTVKANQLEVSDNGHKVSFDGDVVSMFDNDGAAPKAASFMTESAR
jgi:lipopolysaccharide export system protein LptC